jgi:hypothetical protein
MLTKRLRVAIPKALLMLFNTSVLEYNGLDRWNYPNPAVLRSELFQRALREISPDA